MGFVGSKNNKLFIDFYYNKQRFRVYLSVIDTPKNRRFAEIKLKKVEEEIEFEKLGIRKANLSQFFPDDKRFMENDTVVVSKTDTIREMKLSDYFSNWLATKTHLSKNSIRTWKSFYNNYVHVFLGNKKIKEITNEDVLRMHEYMKQNLKNSVINKKIVNIKGLFKELVEEGVIETNPFKKLKTLRNEPADILPFNEEELKKLLDIFKSKFPHYYNFVAFLAFSGCRPNEAIALQWKHIDWGNKIIMIRRGYVLGEFTLLKTASSIRDIDMSQILFEILTDQIEISYGISDLVFINKRNKIICWENFRQKFHLALKYAGIESRPAYQLRHTFASMALKNGEDPTWVAKMLGHSSVKTTFSTYNRYIRNKNRTDGEVISNLFSDLKEGKNEKQTI